MRKIAIINSIIAYNDAISASVIDTYLTFSELGLYQVSLFCYRSDYSNHTCHVVSSVSDLIFHPDFIQADILIWHFGVEYGLFNATIVGNGHAPRIVCFHNVTPKEFTPKNYWPTIDRSLEQCHLLRDVEEVWAVSKINAQVARDLGVSNNRIYDMPLVVETGRLMSPVDKAKYLINILFVGRFVQSKGVLELLAAVNKIYHSGVEFEISLAGNVDFSNADYIKNIYDLIATTGLEDVVKMHGTVDDQKLDELYKDAHIIAIPSYHEGFCKPVIEGLRSGCIPVGYSAYNMPYIANGFGRLVPPGDVEGLEIVLRELIGSLPYALGSPSEANIYLDMGKTSLDNLASSIQVYLKNFSRTEVSKKMIERVNALL